jgi:hypothetical protein
MHNSIETVIKDVNSSLPERKLAALLERSNLSADAKALLSDIVKVTVKVGSKTLAIGRKILTFVFDLIKTFPTITLGVLTALVLTSLIAAIPLLGGLLASFAASLLLVLGFGAGALNDFLSDKLKDRIDNLIVSFDALKAG